MFLTLDYSVTLTTLCYIYRYAYICPYIYICVYILKDKISSPINCIYSLASTHPNTKDSCLLLLFEPGHTKFIIGSVVHI